MNIKKKQGAHKSKLEKLKIEKREHEVKGHGDNKEHAPFPFEYDAEHLEALYIKEGVAGKPLKHHVRLEDLDDDEPYGVVHKKSNLRLEYKNNLIEDEEESKK